MLTQQSSDIEMLVTVSLNTVFCNVVKNLNEHLGIQGSGSRIMMFLLLFFIRFPTKDGVNQ